MSNKLVILLASAVLVACVAVGWKIEAVRNAKNSPLPDIAAGMHWAQVFSDDFNGISLATNKWATCYDWYSKTYNGCTNPGNNELEWYTPEQVTVQDGYAQLKAVASPIMGLNGSKQAQTFPYQSGMISTGRSNWNSQLKESFLYGYFVARIKVTSGQGIWPAFWLVPADHSWPPEIDVMEILGENPNSVLMTNHWGTADSPQKDVSIFTGLTDSAGWHTYAIDWQPGHIEWYIDGVLRKSVTSNNVPSKPMEVIADLAVGGNLPGNPNKSTPFPATLDVDYIRVYQEAKN